MKIRFRCKIPAYKKLSFTDSGKSKINSDTVVLTLRT